MVMDTLESSGNSTVDVVNDVARQTFRSPLEYQRVKQVSGFIQDAGPINVFLENRVRYTFMLQPLHTQLMATNDARQLIEWKAIHCLNQDENYLWNVQQNIEKFLWDILRGLVGMHVLGYLHNDPTVDNIGIRDGHFVLFDYNMSKPVTGVDSTSDFYKLIRSLRYHFDHKLPFDWSTDYLYNLEDFVYIIQKQHGFKKVSETIRYLDSLKLCLCVF